MAAPEARAQLIAPLVSFLPCRTPPEWIDAALADLETLLIDHASLELRAAQQAQKLIARYGSAGRGAAPLNAACRLRLLRKLSRLAREELRHFEQVVELLAARDIAYEPVSASRYARALHGEIRNGEPERCVDSLLVAAIIEARSCERFAALLPGLEPIDPVLAKFYASLLRSETRHFEDYLALANLVSSAETGSRLETLLDLEQLLMTTPDSQLRFHSGRPTRGGSEFRRRGAAIRARPDR